MYIRHFNLNRRPFSRVPYATGCVMYPGLQAGFDRVEDGIESGSGPVLIVGPSGCGKSTLLALLVKRFEDELTVVTLNCASIDCRLELIQCLLFELGLPFDSDNVGELRLNLIDHLKSPEQCPHGLLLLVDEAHNLPIDVLEELRMITNLVCGSKHQIRLVIAGTRPLEEKLGHPQLESFIQRIAARCYLQKMSRSETMFFALAQLQMCGRDGREIFNPSALEKVFEITDGVPRLVSHLCDHSLKMAADGNRHQIDARIVQTAWLDLQQLPDTTETEVFPSGSDGGVIEFGSLDDGDADEVSHAVEPEAVYSEVGESSQSGLPASADLQQVGTTADLMDKQQSEIDADTEQAVDSTLDSLLQQLNETGQQSTSTEQTSTIRQKPINEMQPLSSAIVSARELAKGHGDIESMVNHETIPQSSPSEFETSMALDELDSVFGSHDVELGGGKTRPEGSDLTGGNQDSGQVAANSISTDELFGSAFEEEPVDEIQSSLLAEQNRISSGLTSKELADLDPGEMPSLRSSTSTLSNEIVPAADPDPNWVGGAKTEPETIREDDVSIQKPRPKKPARANRKPVLCDNSAPKTMDDSDMLVLPEKQVPWVNETNIATPPTSRGQVIRMNYQDLFQQLRDSNPNRKSG